MTFPLLVTTPAAPLTRREISTVLGSIIASADPTENVALALEATISGLHGWCASEDISAAIGEISHGTHSPAVALCAV